MPQPSWSHGLVPGQFKGNNLIFFFFFYLWELLTVEFGVISDLKAAHLCEPGKH